jgi:hypothetical protein
MAHSINNLPRRGKASRSQRVEIEEKGGKSKQQNQEQFPKLKITHIFNMYETPRIGLFGRGGSSE